MPIVQNRRSFMGGLVVGAAGTSRSPEAGLC